VEELRARWMEEKEAEEEPPLEYEFSLGAPEVPVGGGSGGEGPVEATLVSLVPAEPTSTQEITTSAVRALLGERAPVAAKRRSSARSSRRSSAASRLSASGSQFEDPTFTMDQQMKECAALFANDTMTWPTPVRSLDSPDQEHGPGIEKRLSSSPLSSRSSLGSLAELGRGSLGGGGPGAARAFGGFTSGGLSSFEVFAEDDLDAAPADAQLDEDYPSVLRARPA